MDHHSKRRRLLYEDPDAELYENRARNDLHLKSRFEAIFEKFGKDFSEVGDEIDMQTGEIVVNKGHIDGMAHEQDLGEAIESPSQLLSRHGTATDDVGDSPVDSHVASSIIESTAESLLGSDTDMDDEPSDSAVDLLDRNTSQTAASSSQKPLFRQHRRTQAPELDETPLRRLNVDSVLNRLHHRQMPMYDSPIEPAWQVPPLPIDKIAQAQQPIPTPRWSEENEKRRLPSPNLGSLWTPLASRGPAKNEAASRKATSKRARAEVWTLKEERLLRQLRTGTKLSYRQMMPYFPGRSSSGISCHWLQKLVPGLSMHPEYSANNSDPTVTEIIANADDSDVDELQAYDYVFQPSKTVVQSKKIREPSPNAFLSRQGPTSPRPTAQVPFEDFLDSLQQHSRSESPEVQGHSSPSVDHQTPQESHPASKIDSYQKSTSKADPAAVPHVVLAAFTASPTDLTLKARNRKEYVSPNKATTTLNTPRRSADDLSEDELATPVTFPRNANLGKVLTGSNTSTMFPKLQNPDLESGSEDELSILVQQRLVPKKLGTGIQKGATKRRKSSFW